MNRATARRGHGHESAGAGPTVVYPHRVNLFGKAQDALPLWTEERHVLPHFPIPCGAFDALPPVVVVVGLLFTSRFRLRPLWVRAKNDPVSKYLPSSSPGGSRGGGHIPSFGDMHAARLLAQFAQRCVKTEFDWALPVCSVSIPLLWRLNKERVLIVRQRWRVNFEFRWFPDDQRCTRYISSTT